MAAETTLNLQRICQTLEVSRSGYYAHRRKLQRCRRQQDQKLCVLLKEAFEKSRRTYGAPRLRAALARVGERCGKNRIRRLMRENALRPRQKRRFRLSTTQSDPRAPAAENWLSKVPTPARPDQIWVSDITYLPTAEGWLYLAVILDLCSRRVVGWSIAESLESSLVTEALEAARHTRRPPPGLLHHSDRGSQYASRAFTARLQTFRAVPSMSRPGNPYDNALAESFFATFKTECFDHRLPHSKAQARLLTFDYIEIFYNRQRLHSAIGYQTPVEFETQFIKT